MGPGFNMFSVQNRFSLAVLWCTNLALQMKDAPQISDNSRPSKQILAVLVTGNISDTEKRAILILGSEWPFWGDGQMKEMDEELVV